MALDFFYTLNEKKKTRILDAIEKCMQTSEYEKLSINDIAEEADISRGSFYNYFVDKNDAVETLVREKISYISDVFKSSIINNNYSLFDGIYFGYFQIKDTLQKNIFMTIINNLKFFIDTGIKIAYSKEYEGEFAKNIDWLIENT
ncbi:MAG: TetR/AcrR family transcriptional regulator, partial [Lachnospiraceae bacterium]|nr:TetR/AcrR family transcriptional regulator [Lachnospiraceae bacterium]